MQKKRILIGKIGKSILFDSKKWSAIGGDIDAPVFYENIIKRHPEIDFYLLGKSDFSFCPASIRNRINVHGNVYDMYEGCTEYINENLPRLVASYEGRYTGANLDQYSRAKGLFEYITDIQLERLPKMDGGIFFSGPDGTSNLPDMVSLSRTPDQLSSPLVSLIGYTGPIYHYLNKTKLPYLLLVTDPRYYPPRGNDIMHVASKVLSQFNCKVKHNHYTSYTNTEKVFHDVNVSYNGIETIFLMTKEQGNVDDAEPSLDAFFQTEQTDKQSKFMIVLNEGRPSRYEMLKEYVLDQVQDVNIYGKWSDPRTAKDTRFKGPKKFNDLQKLLLDVKYTFIIPIKKGWVTAKFWEMIHYGIIPFMHPTYDTQNNLKCPDFIRVKSAKDLMEKIDYLEKNPDAYNDLRKQLQDMLTPELYSGEYLDRITMDSLKEIGVLND